MSEEQEQVAPERAPEKMDKGSRLEAAKAYLRTRREEVDAPAAPAEEAAEGATAAPESPGDGDPIAARILGGAPPEAPAELPAVDGGDPSLQRLVELDMRQRERERELAERDRELREREQRLSDPRQKRIAELLDIVGEGDELEAERALKLLDRMGVSFEALTQAAVAGKAPVRTEERLREEWEAKLQETQAKFEEELRRRDEALEAQRMEAWRAETSGELEGDTKRWGLLNDPRVTAGKRPVDLVEQYLRADFEAKHRDLASRLGRAPTDDEMRHHASLLTPQEAADRLEAEYERRVRETTVKRGPSKLDQLLGLTTATPPASPGDPAASPGAAPADGPRGAKTLTNGQASEVPDRSAPRTREDYRRLAQEEARRVRQQKG